MTAYSLKSDRSYKGDDVVGHVVPRTVLYEGHGIQTSIVTLEKDRNRGYHRHDSWIRVFVLKGRLCCSIDDRTRGPGDSYFVEPGDEHIEIGLGEGTEVLLIKKLPNIQYSVEKPA